MPITRQRSLLQPAVSLEGLKKAQICRPGHRTDKGPPTVNQVAEVIDGIRTIGEACNSLTGAGWRATIAGNRITINDEVFAEYVSVGVGSADNRDATWMVYALGRALLVWRTAAERQI